MRRKRPPLLWGVPRLDPQLIADRSSLSDTFNFLQIHELVQDLVDGGARDAEYFRQGAGYDFLDRLQILPYLELKKRGQAKMIDSKFGTWYLRRKGKGGKQIISRYQSHEKAAK